METYNIIGIKIDSEKEEILEGNISCIRKAKYLLNEYQKNYGIRWKVILKINQINKMLITLLITYYQLFVNVKYFY